MQSLDDMVIFAAVVDAKGFSAAAQVLKISTPVVSKRINALEGSLGAKLLNRTTRRISLTEAGNVFYRYCTRVVAEAQAAEAAVTYLHDEPRGLLRITAPVTFGSQQIASVLPDFMARYPEIQVDLDVSDHSVDLAEAGYDIALRITNNPPPLLAARLLTQTRRIVCAAPAYWDQYGRPEQPKDLEHHNCIVYSPHPNFNEWYFESENGSETVSVHGRFKVNNTTAMLEVAAGGLGVIMLTSFAVQRQIQAGILEPVLENYSTPGSDIYALYLPNRFLSRKARVFIDYLVELYDQTKGSLSE
ncbi:MAG: LysR family transcriptional regulator [Pseudomonadales bacterium]|nr:LysR family transcriptional regulator [Pseudomonadales bacterium]